jgi:hypothetical protein
MKRYISFLMLCSTLYLPTLSAQCDFTEVEIETTTVNWGAEVGWEIWDENDNVLTTFQATADNAIYSNLICLEDGCYSLYATDTYGDGWNGGSVRIIIGDEEWSYALQDGSEGLFAFGVNTDGCIVEVPGCTDPDAINYNPLATVDDGSCTTIEGILEQQSISVLINSGPKDNRINWAIQNRGMPNPNNAFESEEQFLELLNNDLVQTFTVGGENEKMPYARYRNFFNLYAWWWPDAPSQETGWSWPILKGIRDLYFLPWADDEHGWATLFSISRTGGGGGAGVQPETRTGDGLMFGTGWETLLHEFGHTMPQVPDEYTASGEWSGGNCWESANTTAFTIRDSIPWRKWIEEDTKLPTPYTGENLNKIGAFEGALTNYFGCHRPTARGCYMGAGGFGEGYGQDLCPPCRQRVICHLYKYVDVIENPTPANPNVEVTGTSTMTFSADMVKPEPNTQVYTWLLNGKVIARGVESVDVTFGACDQYELTLTVEDTISWVRYDEHFDHIYPRPFESHTWTINQTDVASYNLAADLEVTPVDCAGENSGAVAFNITGGQAPYQAYWEGQSVNSLHEGLAEGNYDYWIVDAQSCGIQASALITADPKLELDICSEYEDNWQVTLNVDGYEPADLQYTWSTGSTTPTVSGLSDGDYTVSVTTADGCEINRSFTLATPAMPLSSSHEYIPSSTGDDVGAVYVNVVGGQPNYSIKWYEKTIEDLTVDDPDAAIASGTNFDHFPEYVFDDNLFTKWLQLGDSDLWIGHHFPQGQVINYYAITSGDDVPGRDPQNWRLEGSMDGVSWDQLDIQAEQEFPSRRERKLYKLDNNISYQYYRLYITTNHGADAIQIQELEFIGLDSQADFIYNPNADGQFTRLGLAPGGYRYQIRDNNESCESAIVNVVAEPTYTLTGIKVVQEGSCSVTIESPTPGYTYYWLSSEVADEILDIGLSFQPPQSGNYWVAAVEEATGAMSQNRPGFAVTMPEVPTVSEVEEGILGIENPDPDLIYRWYDASCGGALVAEGTTFEPGPEAATYWVSAWWATPFPEAVAPSEIPGMIMRLDASDLDADGLVDDPTPVSSSLYDWSFTPSNGISEGSWFAFRGNQQNGLGIADFATMWYQCAEESINGYQTVVMAYQENLLSWEGTSPFYGLSDRIPYSAMPEEQLYSDGVPQSTLDGLTYYNGASVDPMNTANTMEFSILAQTFTEPAGGTECTDTHWEGRLAELLFYDNPLNDEQLTGISEYLRKKWISTADLESPRIAVEWDGTMVATEELNTHATNWLIMPNPVADQAMLVAKGEAQEVQNIILHDALGKTLYKRSINGLVNQLPLDNWLNHLSSGIYYISILSTDGERSITKLIKQ